MINGKSQYALPFAKVVAGEAIMAGTSGSATVQFFDIFGNPIGAKGRKLSSLKLIYIYNGEPVDATSSASFDANAGKISIKLNT